MHTGSTQCMHALATMMLIVLGPLADESRIVVVGGGTCADAIVAAGAAIEIDEHRFRAVEKAMVGEEVERPRVDRWVRRRRRRMWKIDRFGTRR